VSGSTPACTLSSWFRLYKSSLSPSHYYSMVAYLLKHFAEELEDLCLWYQDLLPLSKIFRTGAAIYTAVVVAQITCRCRTTMSSESVCQVTRIWVDVGSFHTRFVVRFMIFTALARNILDWPMYTVTRLRSGWEETLGSILEGVHIVWFPVSRLSLGLSQWGLISQLFFSYRQLLTAEPGGDGRVATAWC
jgi:hypothetical protein